MYDIYIYIYTHTHIQTFSAILHGKSKKQSTYSIQYQPFILPTFSAIVTRVLDTWNCIQKIDSLSKQIKKKLQNIRNKFVDKVIKQMVILKTIPSGYKKPAMITS